MAKIQNIWAREILDSRGIPTVECALMTSDGGIVVSSVPSGTSTGKHEALELRDGDEKRFRGKGVLKAVENIETILGPAIKGLDPTDQISIDQKLIALDGTKNKSKLGANAILAVSLAVCKAAATTAGLSLYQWVKKLAQNAGINVGELKIPIPVFNLINGGLHGAGNLDFQEFQIIPASSKAFSEGLRTASEVYHFLEDALRRKGAIHSVGDEGGYAPNLFTNTDAFEIIVEAVSDASYQIGVDFFLGLDVAASAFYKDGVYPIRDRSEPLTHEKLIEFFIEVNKKYRLIYLEDPLDEDAWGSWVELTSQLGKRVMVVGDDLLATNPERVKTAIEKKACNAILVKPNQIGTITETLNVVKLCRDAGWKVIVSHRSGETNDWFIADFAVGIGSDFVKFGAPARGERVVKYNRLLAIQTELESGV